MRKFLQLSIVALTLIACQEDQREKQPLIDEVKEIQQVSDLEAAKATLDEMFFYAEQLKNGEISADKHAALSYPVGQKFREQKANLSEEERAELSEYGHKKYDRVFPEGDRIVVHKTAGN